MNNQIFYTVFSGVLVFVFGQILQRFVLEPIQNYKKTVGKIDNRLKFYSNILTNVGFESKFLANITDIIRELSCDIEAEYKQIPFSNVFSFLKIIQSKKEVAKAAKGLIFLSNIGGREENKIKECNERMSEVRNLLKIQSLQ